ncbi:hypothetical protein T484DRAFT_1916519 [Baffinella frigidus]|nr:hypothetical protein T484DRAFT_1916519 [Cryptophyta sp. CCMP2293]
MGSREMEEELALDDVQEAGAGWEVRRYITPQELLEMAESKRHRLFEQALDHPVLRTWSEGCLQPSDLQLPILPSPPTVKQRVPGYPGYEDGWFDPHQLGVACIVVPQDRRAPTPGATFNFNADGRSQGKTTGGLEIIRMTTRPRKGEKRPELAGKYLKILLKQPSFDCLVPDKVPAAKRNNREPYGMMHMRKKKRGGKRTKKNTREPAEEVQEVFDKQQADTTMTTGILLKGKRARADGDKGAREARAGKRPTTRKSKASGGGN